MFIRHHVYLLFEENLRSVLLANRRQVSVPADLDIFGVGKETAFEALVGSTPSGIY